MNIKRLLQTKAKQSGVAYRQLLTHYAMERFLYRLSCSSVADRFYLKGGMLLMGMGAVPARTTMDIDLLGRIDRNPENIRKVFNSILRASAPANDQVAFSMDFHIEEIMKDALYAGSRVSLKANVLGVLPGTLETVGAVSEEVVRQMVCGVARLMTADCAIATSGIAGPGGGSPEKPVGTVWVAVRVGNVVKTKKLQLCDAGRVRNVCNATLEALRFMYETLLEVK